MSETAGKEFALIVGRELDRLSELVASYRDPASLWRVTGAAQNPPGTLALHLAGNLEHYVGAVLGGTGYVRDRDAEFRAAGTIADLEAHVAAGRQRFVDALAGADWAATCVGQIPSGLD